MNIRLRYLMFAGGTFTMGSDGKGLDGFHAGAMEPPHKVTVSSFYIDITEVTQEKYMALMGVNPSRVKGEANLPVDSVTWYDTVVIDLQSALRYLILFHPDAREQPESLGLRTVRSAR